LEEEHSTRCRARLLYEMMEGDVLRDGWRSDAVREALDLCLSCKGCRRECPVQVDMATYKAEFLHHHYAGRIRPRAAYALGSIDRWARLASYAPRLANGILGAPGLRRLAKWAAGVAPERDLPRFAPRTFRESFTQRAERNPDAPRVLLFPDTFTNHFDPQIAMAAADVLEAAGFRVDIPERILCCGRPLYDFGRLDRARRLLGQVLETLHEDIEAGTPVVGLEPSCVAVFRDEMTHLLPNDHDARRLRDQVYTLGEFLTAHDVAPPLRPRLAAALVQRHCHHQAVMGFELDEAALARTGTDYTLLDSGCCGMAGAFGFERGHYDVSVAIAERRLLPAIRQAPPGTTLVADGFSCRTQIQQLTGQRAFHLAEVLQQCLAEPEPRTPTPGAARPLDRQRARHRWRERETAWARPPSPP
jgi:Fe-S oxidoreductase